MPDYTPIYNLPYLSELDKLKETPTVDESFAAAVEGEIAFLNARIDDLDMGGGGMFEGVHGEYYVKRSTSKPTYRHLYLKYDHTDLSAPGTLSVSEQDQHNYSKDWVQDYSSVKVGDETRIYLSEESGRWFRWRVISDAVYHENVGGVPYYTWDIDRGEVYNSTNPDIGYATISAHMGAGNYGAAWGGDGGDGGDGGGPILGEYLAYKYRYMNRNSIARDNYMQFIDYDADNLSKGRVSASERWLDDGAGILADYSSVEPGDLMYITMTTSSTGKVQEFRWRISEKPTRVLWHDDLYCWDIYMDQGVLLEGEDAVINDAFGPGQTGPVRFVRP